MIDVFLEFDRLENVLHSESFKRSQRATFKSEHFVSSKCYLVHMQQQLFTSVIKFLVVSAGLK